MGKSKRPKPLKPSSSGKPVISWRLDSFLAGYIVGVAFTLGVVLYVFSN